MNKARTVRINLIFVIVVLLLFCLIFIKLYYVALGKKIDGIDLTEFANNRDIKNETIVAPRGTIYDANGEILAQDVNSYTVIAYLSEKRTEDINKPYHVVDKEYTAKMLSPLINMTEEKILSLLNNDTYQVELGPGGRGISELLKEQIEELELPGISFTKSVKRYYPNSNFLSYTLGYAKTDESNNIVGELGIELEYNDILTGKNGYKKYQQDMYGYKIANTPETKQDAKKGDDVYLTIDTNIQMFTEQAMSKLEDAKVEWATLSVVDAKTGAILGVASSPNFDPNTKDLTSYYDPLVSYTYEPGSVMKIFSFLAAMENGTYNGSEVYKSGSIQIDDAVIKDWNKKGWGNITFNQAFYASSNVGAIKLVQKVGRQKLFDFYTNLGFGTQTGINLPNEQYGTINFKYNTEIASASFGQSISVTAIQMIQGLTAITNDGTTLKPYIVSKIIDPNSGDTVYEGKRTEVKKVASKENVEAIKSLMRGVVDGKDPIATGKAYNVKGFDVLGKTGTAQIASKSGGYQTGDTNYVRSFAGIFPGNDPKVIIYLAVSKIKNSSAMSSAVTGLIQDTGTYLGIKESDTRNSIVQFNMKSYKNQEVKTVESELNTKNVEIIIIGDGEKVINQYPEKGSVVNEKDKIFLLTNGFNYTMPNMKGWSRGDVNNYSSLTNIAFTFKDYGYVKSFTKKVGEAIMASDVIELTLEPKYKTLEEEIKKQE